MHVRSQVPPMSDEELCDHCKDCYENWLNEVDMGGEIRPEGCSCEEGEYGDCDECQNYFQELKQDGEWKAFIDENECSCDSEAEEKEGLPIAKGYEDQTGRLIKFRTSTSGRWRHAVIAEYNEETGHYTLLLGKFKHCFDPYDEDGIPKSDSTKFTKEMDILKLWKDGNFIYTDEDCPGGKP